MFYVCCHPEILLSWEGHVTTSFLFLINWNEKLTATSEVYHMPLLTKDICMHEILKKISDTGYSTHCCLSY